MAYNFQFLDATGSASADGVFLPVASLPGIQASEFASTESTATRNSKALFALLNRCFSVMSPDTFGKLGVSVSKNPMDGVDNDVFNQTFIFSWQQMVNLTTKTISQIPVPTSGANNGVGDFSILDVFPGASKVASGDNLSGAGLLVPTASLTPYTSLTHAALTISATSDNREWFCALWDHLAIDAPVRSTAVQSAIIAANASAITGLAIPASFTSNTDPISGIAATDRPRRGLISRTLTYTIQCVANQSTQTFDVRIA